MSNEEAIKNIVAYIYFNIEDIPEEVGKAFDVAITVLKERPQGEWKFIQGATTQGSLKCPFCDYRDYHKTNSNFCPNCGAKMKGKNSSGEAYD